MTIQFSIPTLHPAFPLRATLGNAKGHEAEFHWITIKDQVEHRECLAETVERINGFPVLTLLVESFALKTPVVEIVTAPYTTQYNILISTLQRLFEDWHKQANQITNLESILPEDQWFIKRNVTVHWCLRLESFHGMSPKAVHTTVDLPLERIREKLLPLLKRHSYSLLANCLNKAPPIEALLMWTTAGRIMYEKIVPSANIFDSDIFGGDGKNFLGVIPRFPVAALLYDSKIDVAELSQKVIEAVNPVLMRWFPKCKLFEEVEMVEIRQLLELELKEAAEGKIGVLNMSNTQLAPVYSGTWIGSFEIRDVCAEENLTFHKVCTQILMESMPWDKL